MHIYLLTLAKTNCRFDWKEMEMIYDARYRSWFRFPIRPIMGQLLPVGKAFLHLLWKVTVIVSTTANTETTPHYWLHASQ